MTDTVLAIGPDSTVVEAARMMVEQSVHRLLVVSGPDHPVGIVTSLDLLGSLVGRGPDPAAKRAQRLP